MKMQNGISQVWINALKVPWSCEPNWHDEQFRCVLGCDLSQNGWGVNFTVLVYSMLDWPISLFVDPRLNRESEVQFSARIYPKSRLIDWTAAATECTVTTLLITKKWLQAKYDVQSTEWVHFILLATCALFRTRLYLHDVSFRNDQ